MTLIYVLLFHLAFTRIGEIEFDEFTRWWQKFAVAAVFQQLSNDSGSMSYTNNASALQQLQRRLLGESDSAKVRESVILPSSL